MLCIRPRRVIHSTRTFLARFKIARTFSSTRPICQKGEDVHSDDPLGDVAELMTDGEDADDDTTGGDSAQVEYEDWIAIDGQKWRNPTPLARNWLGGDIPFPLNRTFRPPTPVSDALRTVIYKNFVANPKENDTRTLSMRYGVSAERVEAIIRLKELEVQWKKGRQLQSGFLRGMERLLGIRVGDGETSVKDEVQSVSRREIAEADEVSRQMTSEVQDKGSSVSRTFFEPFDEGQQPLVSHLLDEERQKARTSRLERRTFPTKIIQPDPTKPVYKFIDVGLRWVDRTDLERRAKESARRKAIKNAPKQVIEDSESQ